jgi:predicted nucleic acid-binding Zn ribbon protein
LFLGLHEGMIGSMEKGGQSAPEKRCPFCAEVIHAEAKKCKHCGELLDESLRAARAIQNKSWNPGVAAVLSLLIPGAGQTKVM